MKPSNATLIALLATRQFYAVDLFVFTLVDGTVLRYCAGDKDIIYSATTYPCGGTVGPYFQKRGGDRGLFKQRIGVEVDTLQFDVLPGTATVQGIAFLQACRLGVFDGATMILYRAFMPTYGDTSAGLVNIFTGRVVEIDISRSIATFNINSHLELLSQQSPRELYQAGCLNTLFDAGCTLNSATYRVSGTVTSATASVIGATLAQATGYFDQGKIVFTSGNNNGFTRTVKSFTTGGTINLLVPLPYVPAVSDTFYIYPGCDKTMSTCSSKFGNIVNFRGQPFVPSPETGI